MATQHSNCKVYELIKCELDSSFNDQSVGFFDSPRSIINYLTDGGKSSAKLSVFNHNEDDQQYIEEAMESPNLTLVLHREADENQLLGYFCPETDTYYYVKTHEVRTY